MLQLEASGIPFSASQHSEILRSGPLEKRNEASIRYRMRNISCVMEERGAPVLRAFSSAPRVGRNVKRRLHALLDARSDALQSLSHMASRAREKQVGLKEAVESLTRLENMIADWKRESEIGIGHNNPPEKTEVLPTDFSEALIAVTEIRKELLGGTLNSERISGWSEKIAGFGLKVSIWAGQRFDDFAKAGAMAAGTSLGLSLSGLGDQIIETLKTLFQFLI